jgi:drug/metabolite transporter (DMT)-like permease
MLHIGPLLFIAARGLIAALALAPLAYVEHWRAARRPAAAVLPIAVVGGIAFFAGAALQQIGLKTATVTNAGFLTALYVVLVPLMAWYAFRRPPTWLVWPAVIASFVGTWLLGGGSLGGFSAGDGLVAASSIFWALHVVVTARAIEHRRPVLFTSVQFAVVGALGLACALAFEAISLQGLIDAAPQILFVGLLSSALTFTILSAAMRWTPPSEAAVIVSTETLFAALAGALLLGERLSLVGWTGASMILAAVLLVQLGPGLVQRTRSSNE